MSLQVLYELASLHEQVAILSRGLAGSTQRPSAVEVLGQRAAANLSQAACPEFIEGYCLETLRFHSGHGFSTEMTGVMRKG